MATHQIASTYAARIIEASYRKRVFIAYGGLPYCVRSGMIFSMMPLEWPSIGYSLSTTDLDGTVVLHDPKILTELEAMKMACGNV